MKEIENTIDQAVKTERNYLYAKRMIRLFFGD